MLRFASGQLPVLASIRPCPLVARRATTIVPVTIAALLIGVAAVCGGVAFATVRTITFWRTFRTFGRTLGGDVESFSARLDALSRHDPPQTEALDKSLGRLRRSTAQLSILLNALARVRQQWAGLLAVYPRK